MISSVGAKRSWNGILLDKKYAYDGDIRKRKSQNRKQVDAKPGTNQEWKRSQARSHSRMNSSFFLCWLFGLSRPSPNGPLLDVDGPLPRGGLPPSSYSARARLLLPPLRPLSPCLMALPVSGDGGVGGWWPP
jgi:hypothetical protein